MFVYARIFWDLLGSELKKDYLKNIEVFPLPHLPDMDSVCAYYHKERGLHGSTQKLLDTFREFFNDYAEGKLSNWERK